MSIAIARAYLSNFTGRIASARCHKSPENLMKLIRQGEGLTVEFKKSTRDIRRMSTIPFARFLIGRAVIFSLV